MKCPTCQTEMLEGYLKAGGGSIKWFFSQQSWLTKFFSDGQAVTDLWGKTKGGYCEKCGVIQIPELKLKLPKT